MLSEYQPYTLDYCYKCGAQAVACEDWAYPKWVGGDPDCLHEINYHGDEELEEVDEELERIDQLINSINNLSKKVRGMTATLTGFMGE